jgi:ubiquinol-cytochrome c reductase cytochrome b subunit
LFAYAILRSIPNKLGGVIGLFSSLLILFIVPIIQKFKFKAISFYPLAKILFWLFVVRFSILTVGGA